MSLRVKVELILFILMGLVIMVSYGIQRLIILPRLNPLEERVAQEDMIRCVDEIQHQVTRLDKLGAEWKDHREVVGLLKNPEPPAAAPRLDVQFLLKNQVTFVYVVRTSGEIAWRKSVDLARKKETAESVFDIQPWDPFHPLLTRDGAAPSTSGLLATSYGPALVSVHPVVDPDEPERLLGTLALGRMFDEDFLLGILRQTAVPLRMWTVSDPSLPEEAATVLRTIAGANLLHVSHTSHDLFRVYTTYRDIYGKPALVLQSDVHRETLAKAYDAMQNGLLAQVGIALTALLVLIVLFRRAVMSPLNKLTKHTTAIGKTDDLTARLSMNRSDEFGTLSREFDRMVGRLEEDIAQRKRAEEALRESEERYALAVRGANDGLWDWNLRTDRVYFSSRWKSMLGFKEDEIGDSPDHFFEYIHPEDRDYVKASLSAHLKNQSDHFQSEYRIRHRDGAYLWTLCRGLAIRDSAGLPTRIAGSLTDVTTRKAAEEQLAHQAFHDSLTALPNRALLLDRLGQALRHAKRNKEYKFAVLFCDLDRFKVVNDGLGHAVGDTLLALFGEKLMSSLRSADTVARSDETVARFGGDEFVILLDNIRDNSDATRVAERIQEMLKAPFRIQDNEIYTTVSIGIALSNSEDTAAEDFLRNADTAMYRAKARGKACFEIFDAEMHARAVARLQLETDLRGAIERGELTLFFQPIVSLKSGAIEAFEALLRWQHPTRGLVLPYEFVPLAEETGMIAPIGRWAFRAACRQARNWQMKHPRAEQLAVSVNVSVKELLQPQFLEGIENDLIEVGLEPRFVRLEITESAIMENLTPISSLLAELQTRKIHLSVDDFGTGYSSLSYLHRLPLDTLKIDQTFVRNMRSQTENAQIIKTILLLAQNLDLNVVAEGIENRQQVDMLQELNCELGQGYFFSQPLDPAHAACLLESEPRW